MSPDDEKVAAFRELLPATAAGIYLDTASRGPLPSETAAAMREAEDWELRVGRVWEGRDDDVRQRHDEARAVVGALLGADPDQITLAPTLESAVLAVSRELGTAPEDVARLVHPWTGELTRGRPSGVVDISMAVGAIPVQVEDLGADAAVLAADKWLLGPESVAVIWTSPRAPHLSGLSVPRTSLLGLARTVGWLEMYVGLEWIYERTAALARRLHAALTATPGVDVTTPADAMAAIVSFRLANWPSDRAAEELSRRALALIRIAPDMDAIRASVGWFNTEDELDRFAAAVRDLAGHTPETLPRRPNLIVLASE